MRITICNKAQAALYPIADTLIAVQDGDIIHIHARLASYMFRLDRGQVCDPIKIRDNVNGEAVHVEGVNHYAAHTSEIFTYRVSFDGESMLVFIPVLVVGNMRSAYYGGINIATNTDIHQLHDDVYDWILNNTHLIWRTY